MEEIWGYFLLSLFYLTLTSGLSPGANVNHDSHPPAPIPLNSSRTTNPVQLIDKDGRRSPSLIIHALQSDPNLPLPPSSSTSTSASPSESTETATTRTTPVDRMILDEPSSTSQPPAKGSPTDKSSNKSESENESEDEEKRKKEEEPLHNNTTDTPVHAPLVQNTTKVQLRGKCMNTSQCFGDFVECRNTVCKCQPGYLPRIDNGDLCGEASLYHVEIPQADPTMIGVVIGLALMSVTLCVVLRMFAKARFRENRTIFNTPNPRLMNVSLLKGGSKTLLRGNSAPRSRRGSTASARSGMLEPGTPTSPLADVHGPSHDHGNGNAIPLAGSSSRPSKPLRQISTDTSGGGGAESTPSMTRPASAINKQKYRQDSVASNV